MNRKNKQICANCEHTNPLHSAICEKCNYQLFDKIPNINLFQTLSNLIDSPKKAFINIIRAEHKNYIPYLVVLIASKIFITGYLTAAHLKLNPVFEPIAYPIAIAAFAVFVLFIAYLSNLYNRLSEWRNRMFDNFALLVYSMIPLLFGMLILLPLEFIVFGSQLFTVNPSPFIINEAFAYIFTALEGIILIWTIFLTARALFLILDSVFLSILLSILLLGGLHYAAIYGLIII